MQRKFQKIMLIMPSNTMPADSVRRIAEPLGLLYIGAVLKKEAYEVNILDSTCEGYWNSTIKEGYITYGLSDEQIMKRIRDFSPDIVGVSSMFSAHQENALHHCDLVKQVNPNTLVVIGGIHPSLDPEGTIKHKSVDYVILGEGEYRFAKLLEALNSGKEPDFDGIVYKKNKEIILKPMMTRIENLDKLPFPARELIDMEKYIEIGVPYAPFPRKQRTAQLMTSRGCPFHCFFCSTSNFWGHKFRTRSVNNIIKEVEKLINKYKIEEIQFSDDNMTVDKERAKALFRALRTYNLAWCTPHGLMINTLDEEMIKLMAESGAYQLTFAPESGSERVLKEIIHKPVPPKEQVKKLVDLCHKYNIQVHGLFVVGFPGETREEIEQTLQYPYYVGFDSVSFFIANPVPGSQLYMQCKEKGYLPKGKRKIDFKSAEICIPEDSPEFVMSGEELIKLVDNKTKEFNEWSKARNPEAWEIKFKQFLKKHGDKADLILGRVT